MWDDVSGKMLWDDVFGMILWDDVFWGDVVG